MTKAFAAMLKRLKKDGVPQTDLDNLKATWEAARALPKEGTAALFPNETEHDIQLPEEILSALGQPGGRVEGSWKITPHNNGDRSLIIRVPADTPEKKKG